MPLTWRRLFQGRRAEKPKAASLKKTVQDGFSWPPAVEDTRPSAKSKYLISCPSAVAIWMTAFLPAIFF